MPDYIRQHWACGNFADSVRWQLPNVDPHVGAGCMPPLLHTIDPHRSGDLRGFLVPLPCVFGGADYGKEYNIKYKCNNPKSVIRLLCANKLSFCHLYRRFSVTMEPHCALKPAIHLFKNLIIIIITLMADLG